MISSSVILVKGDPEDVPDIDLIVPIEDKVVKVGVKISYILNGVYGDCFVQVT